jgi:hypothetical protein
MDIASIRAPLRKAQRDLDGLLPLYEQTLAAKEVSADLQAEIKSILDNQRTPLDYIARELVDRFGQARSGAKVYYPSAPKQSDFASQMRGWMPGVAAHRPDIAAVIGGHQPFQPNHEWMGWLWFLANENKHEMLSPQTRAETRRVRAQGQAGTVEYAPYTPASGGVKFGPGVSIGGVPVDPATQRPVPHPSLDVTEMIYVNWLFTDLGLPVITTLRAMQNGVATVVSDLAQVAGM